MVKEKKQIGTVVSDTGKLVICDPNFLSQWIDNKVESKREYKDVQTNITYTYGIDFKKYDEIIFNGKTVNELIESKRLVRIPLEETGEFSNKSISHGIINKGFSQCKFEDGRQGLAFAFATLSGDGEFPVFAEFEEDRICKIWIDFTINLDDQVDNEEQIEVETELEIE